MRPRVRAVAEKERCGRIRKDGQRLEQDVGALLGMQAPGEGHPGAGQPGQRSRIEALDNRAALEQPPGRDAERLGEGARCGAVGEEGRERPAAARAAVRVSVRPGHGVVLGRDERHPSGMAAAAAHQAPNMCAWTRSAPARRGRSHSAKSVDGTHCRCASRAKVSTGTSKAAASAIPSSVASPAYRRVTKPWERSAADSRSAESCAPPRSSTPMTRATLSRARRGRVSHGWRHEALAGCPGHRHTPALGATVEAEPGLALPPAQYLLLTRAFGVVEDDGGTRARRSRGPAERDSGPTRGRGVSRWAVHHQQVDRVGLQCFA